jgi:hypothetical protein
LPLKIVPFFSGKKNLAPVLPMKKVRHHKYATCQLLTFLGTSFFTGCLGASQYGFSGAKQNKQLKKANNFIFFFFLAKHPFLPLEQDRCP